MDGSDRFCRLFMFTGHKKYVDRCTDFFSLESRENWVQVWRGRESHKSFRDFFGMKFSWSTSGVPQVLGKLTGILLTFSPKSRTRSISCRQFVCARLSALRRRVVICVVMFLSIIGSWKTLYIFARFGRKKGEKSCSTSPFYRTQRFWFMCQFSSFFSLFSSLQSQKLGFKVWRWSMGVWKAIYETFGNQKCEYRSSIS